MIAISDVHGCLKTLKELIKKLPHENIIFLGDLIDRGKDSKGVVEFVKNGEFKCVLGNHEDMAIQVNKEIGTDKYIEILQWWYSNGGDITVESYISDESLLAEHIKWFNNLPLYAEYTNKKGQHYILSHSNINFAWDKKKNKPDEFKQWALWSRYFNKSIYGKSTIMESKNVIGHTPQKNVLEMEELIFIDSGCVYKDYGYGNLSAYNLETGEIYTQENVE